MKRTLLITNFIALVLCLTAQFAFSQNNEPFSINNSPLPKPTSPVMDYAGVMDSATRQRLESTILEFEKQSNPSVELAVAIVKTTGDRDIFDYSLAVARGWGIGSREADNPGALLFIAVNDRKYFTHVSRDLEDELPDGLVGSLQRQYLVPQFKSGNYSKGVEDTINAYIRTIKDKNNLSQEPFGGLTDSTDDGNNRGNDRFSDDGFDCSALFPCLIIIGIILFIIVANGGGGGGGSRRRRRGRSNNVAGDILGGVLTGIVLGGSSGGSSGGGSSWGGGGGSSGGGWGGFGGGGDFGGGGAGGGW